jgi:Flp pilus assembly protein TadD
VSEVREAPAPVATPPLTAEEEAALAEDVDLDPATRRRVLLMHRALDRTDHYALLGASRTADRKELKRAYFELASQIHPDRYFRKKLGSFKQRMEIVFGRLTQAHDVLTSKDKRADYDAYLDEQRRSRSIEDLLADALAEVQHAQETVERQVRAQEPASSPTGAVPSTPSATTSGPPGATSSVPPERPSTPSLTVGARRDALARRLLAGRSTHPTPVPGAKSNPAVVPVSPTAGAMDALRRRYEERMTHAKAAQARKYVANAEAALAANDPVAAANAFRVARSLQPDDPKLAAMAASTQTRADAILFETYTRQAGYEEKNGQWSDAAKSWTRVCKLRPDDAAAHDRGATALVKAERDLHEASRMAQRACALEPANPAFRVSLAKVYLAAGLGLNARRELETATQLAPHDVTIQAMLKRVAKPA